MTDIDLTPEYIDVANELTGRCGLADQIEYRVANALALPFADETFDHVWCHYVTMNILDKARLTKEVARVLRRGGRFSCVEVARGAAGPPDYPVPWAKNAEVNFLVPPKEMRGIVEISGLHVIEQTDITPSILAYAREAADRVAKRHPAPVAHGFVVADDSQFVSGTRHSDLPRANRLISSFLQGAPDLTFVRPMDGSRRRHDPAQAWADTG